MTFTIMPCCEKQQKAGIFLFELLALVIMKTGATWAV